MEERRPNPDELLAAIKRSARSSSEGKLRMFIGMSAGVGKTYAMLSAAHQKIAEGIEVVVGVVETHGRKETLEKLQNLPHVPLKKITHRDVDFFELDLEEVIRRRPHTVIIDELAHTNIPGSRHPKRWQDVIELLENGINVFTAINIQHIESRKDDVEKITEIAIHETVPDSILERADQIEVIDIPPDDLLIRLKEGKVYLGDKAELAAKNFFKQDKLMALRQILLRVSADKVDSELTSLQESIVKNRNWKTQEKLLLALGHGPNSEKLIRTTKQIASNLKSPWVAAYIDTGKTLNQKDQKTLQKNLDLARELGARVITTSEVDLVKGIDRVAQEYGITQILIGKPGRRPIYNFFNGGSIINQLNRLDNNISIHLVRLGDSSPPFFDLKTIIHSSKTSSYLFATLYIAILGLCFKYLFHLPEIIPYRSIGMLFLLGISFAGIIFPLGPTIWASLLTVQVWNYFFIPPLYTFAIGSPDDIALAFSFFFVSVITGILTSTVKKNQSLLRKQEERSRALYRFSQEIVEANTKDECIENITTSLSSFLNASVGINIKTEYGALEYFPRGDQWFFNKPREWAAAMWAFEKGKTAGKWTDTLPDSSCYFIPLTARNDVVGILGIKPTTELPLLVSDREIILTLSSQLALYLQREMFHQSALESERLKKSEKLHQTLLNSVSHEIKTPLTAISGIVSAFETLDESDKETYGQLKSELSESVDRLKQIIDNILDRSRIDSGALTLKEDWFSIDDLIENVLDAHSKQLADFKVRVKIPEDFPLVYIDGKLIEQVFTNLVLNTIRYSNERKVITISTQMNRDNWSLFFSDEGPGISLQFRNQIFQKFFRTPNAPTGGTGLGLSIVKSIIDLHKGNIRVVDQEIGLGFEITLPYYAPPLINEENL